MSFSKVIAALESIPPEHQMLSVDLYGACTEEGFQCGCALGAAHKAVYGLCCPRKAFPMIAMDIDITEYEDIVRINDRFMTGNRSTEACKARFVHVLKSLKEMEASR